MRLGDLDALKTHISELTLVYSGTELNNAILNAIDNTPTIIWCSETSDGLPLMDLRPRPQGKWIENLDSRNDEMQASCYCSECGASCYCATDKFCHECGADMRKGGQNAEGRL